MADYPKDPVCGKEISPADAFASEQHDSLTFHFCSKECYDAFQADPHRYGHPEDV